MITAKINEVPTVLREELVVEQMDKGAQPLSIELEKEPPSSGAKFVLDDRKKAAKRTVRKRSK